MEKVYFGYGANTNIDAMAFRCPAAKPIGSAILRHHKLVFRGVADVEHSRGNVYGALWTITSECEASLDKYEGYPDLYQKSLVVVFHQIHGELEAMVYVMRRKTALEPPAASYVELISEGYRDFSIPMRQLSNAVEEAELDYDEEIEQIRRMELGYSTERWW